jgi:hypothetical protein
MFDFAGNLQFLAQIIESKALSKERNGQRVQIEESST